MTNEHHPEEIFRGLRRSRTTRSDSEALWQRVEPQLEPPPAGAVGRLAAALVATYRRPGLRLAGALAALAGVVIAAWWQPAKLDEIAPQIATQAPSGQTQPAPGLVAGWELDVRLVRGFDGSPPSDVRTEIVDGAGGASRLADLRAHLAALVRFDDFGIVGEWTGQLRMAGSGVTLSGGRTLAFELVGVAADNGALQLRNVWLEGEERLKVASEMTLTPGDPHLIGVPSGAEPDAGQLFLAIAVRSRPVSAPATPSPPQ